MKAASSLAFSLAVVCVIAALSAAPARAEYDPTEEIAEINARIEAQGMGWVAKETPLMQLPPEERQSYLGRILKPGETGILPADAYIERPSSRDLPAVWDWRLQGGVTPVKSQGACGSCWDFAATAAFESVIRITTDRIEDLSEQAVLSCNDQGHGCSGGWADTAYRLFMFPGAVEESCMPYQANDNIECTIDFCEIIDRLDGWADLPTDITSLKESIYDHPVAAAMTVFPDFQAYGGGCYDNPSVAAVNHEVLMVGWDDTACEGEGAWIIKNSWGLGWGIGGYGYVKYGCVNLGYAAQEIFYTPRGPVDISHLPLQDTDNQTEPYEIVCTIQTRDFPVDDDTATLHYNVGEGWIDVLMERQRDGEVVTFRSEIPPQQIGTAINYWLSALDTAGNEDRDPATAPDQTWDFNVLRIIHMTDAEIDQGWTLGLPDDDATTGMWERGIPEGTIGMAERPSNPDRDHTPDPGRRCFCTGLEAGSWYWDNDVDGGKTTLVTPLLDMGDITSAKLSYWRWYINNAGQYAEEDYWKVDVSNDNGATWVNLENTLESLAFWEYREYQLQDFVALSDSMMVRFIAEDYINPSIVEAGVDDVWLTTLEFDYSSAQEPVGIVQRIHLVPGPSPFTQNASLRLEMPSSADGALRVYGADGRVVRTLIDGRLQAGIQQVAWDGRDDTGRPVPTGVYMIRLSSAAGNAQSRLVRLQ